MEPFIADLINNPKLPKAVRYAMVTILCLFIMFLGVSCTVSSPFVWGKIFGIILAAVFLIAEIYLCRKIHKSNK